MIHEIRLPEVGENIESGEIAKVLVAPGDPVEEEQTLIELETDKAVVEVPAAVSGVIKEVLVKEGETVKVGQLLAIVDTEAVPAAKKPEEKETGEAAAEVPHEPEIPGPAVAEAPGAEEVAPPSEPAPVETEAPAPAAPAAPAGPAPVSEETGPRRLIPASPAVRRLARELGVDISQVPGTGPGGRISAEDVKKLAKRLITGAAAPAGGRGIPFEPLPDFSKFGEIERQPMSTIRRKTAEHLSYAWATVPHVTQFDKADITELEAMRKRLAPKVEGAGGKLTFTAILLKVCAEALRRFPQFNASVDMARGEIIYKRYVHIGVAVDTDRGLLVPVIRNVDQKTITELAVELKGLAEKARSRKISPDELQGGNFSISNLGGIGGTYFTPVVNTPEVAILGVSRAEFEPRYRDGEFVPRLMLPLSLSYDHRLIDGADAIRFLRWIVEALENPLELVL